MSSSTPMIEDAAYRCRSNILWVVGCFCDGCTYMSEMNHHGECMLSATDYKRADEVASRLLTRRDIWPEYTGESAWLGWRCLGRAVRSEQACIGDTSAGRRHAVMHEGRSLGEHGTHWLYRRSRAWECPGTCVARDGRRRQAGDWAWADGDHAMQDTLAAGRGGRR